MDDDDDLWGPPPVVQEEPPFKPLRGYEFWFDPRTDVLEEEYQNEKYCEQVRRILDGKKQDTESNELDKVSDSLQKDMASSGAGDSPEIVSSDSDKTLSAISPDADTSSAKSALDEDENTSSISDAQTKETKDSSNDTQVIDPETRKPQETSANDPITVEEGKVAEDADISSSPVFASKSEEAEEHSPSSLVTDQVFDPIKQAPENRSLSELSRENIGGSTLKPLGLETTEKVREKANATNEDGEMLKDQQQEIETSSEPFTTESRLEMCDASEKGRETPCDDRIKSSQSEAVKTAVKDELIVNSPTVARQKAESNALLKPGPDLTKKGQRKSKGMNTSFIRNTKPKVGGEAGEIDIDPVKKSTQSTSKLSRGSSVPAQLSDSTSELIERIRQRDGQTMGDSVTSISELKNKTGKELRSIAKELKMTHYSKLKKEDLLQQIINQLNLQPADCTEQKMES
ncbi:hypothetical protein EUTSA_v10016632mg [Eutrema salsugineum]|uniref:Rho termination factor-like N-terminal domain-containing protein n=1 Tax=Eutrema salsugineum TaxID=72664 RepID=V4LQJ3_EUTSA|nr:uncharacterized protein LOC18026479 [Eutrema salsugineum]ESQ52875.1 hypothetical protein EUTSA_v10016632mg [Eutrema salsugineum]